MTACIIERLEGVWHAQSSKGGKRAPVSATAEVKLPYLTGITKKKSGIPPPGFSPKPLPRAESELFSSFTDSPQRRSNDGLTCGVRKRKRIYRAVSFWFWTWCIPTRSLHRISSHKYQHGQPMGHAHRAIVQ